MRKAGGARRGLDPWILQRASALLMAILLPIFLGFAWLHGPLDYLTWRGLFAPLAVKVGALLFVGALLLHAWIGLREIFIDYLHPMTLRLTLYFLFAVVYLGCLVWAVDILWSVVP